MILCDTLDTQIYLYIVEIETGIDGENVSGGRTLL